MTYMQSQGIRDWSSLNTISLGLFAPKQLKAKSLLDTTFDIYSGFPAEVVHWALIEFTRIYSDFVILNKNVTNAT